MTNLHALITPTFPVPPSPFESIVRKAGQISRDDQTGPIFMDTGPNFCRRFYQKVLQPISIGGLYREVATEEIRISQGRGRLIVAHVNSEGRILVGPTAFNVDSTSVITLPPLTPYRLDVGTGAIVEITASVSHDELVRDAIPFQFPTQFDPA
jgi:hypothetical protein